MPIILLKHGDTKQNISDLVGTITWGGSNNEVSRTLQFEVLHPKHDYYTPRVQPKLGDTIQLLTDDGSEIFRGKVFYSEQVSEQGTIQVTCYDDAIRLSKSKGTFNFKNATAESIARRVCEEINLQVGELAPTSIPQKMIVQGGGLYQTLTDAYKGASLQNGKRYLPIMMQGRLNVIEVGATVIDYVLNDAINIISSSFTESADSIINKVKIYDENDKFLDEVGNKESMNLFGVFQDTYTKEKDKQARAVATNMLKFVEYSVDVTAIGNVKCITGFNIKVEDSTTGVVGVFEISSDTHTWSNGQYEVNLQLIYKG